MSAVCPLCNSTFSLANIEAHASSCHGNSDTKPVANKRKLENMFTLSPKSPKTSSLFPAKKCKVDSSQGASCQPSEAAPQPPQQDSFLPHIESGTITFIGATTENPSFSLNNALLSRCKVITLEKLDKKSIREILERALKEESVTIGDDGDGISIAEDAIEYLATVSEGDARAALNNLELVVTTAKTEGGIEHIGLSEVATAVARAALTYDKTGEQHYHMASALQKSIRGGDDNAALYWLGRMLRGGEEPAFIARRLVRCASEDVGLADDKALPLAVAAMQGSQLLGRPECDVLLAQCAVYLARAIKSHEVYQALGEVYRVIDSPDEGGLPGVPLHLRSGGGRGTPVILVK